MAEEKMYLTKEGYAKLQAEYRDLIDNQRPDVIEALKAARAQGDLSENSEYDAARDRQAKIEGRIQEIEHMFDVIEIIEDKGSGKANKVGFEYFVTFKDLSDNSLNTVKVVSTVEADPLAEPFPFISNASALGNAIWGASEGAKVMVSSAEPYEIEITRVSKDAPKAA